ncbi:MAG: tail fiber domain-containing protein [Chitinophagales bacterium]
MKRMVYFSMIAVAALQFSCTKKSCEANNTGSIMIHNDGSFMPDGVADFYKGPTKLASVNKGETATVDGIIAGEFTLTIKVGADTVYQDLDTIVQCEVSHYSTERFIPVSDKRLKKNIQPISNALESITRLNLYSYEYNKSVSGTFLPSGTHYGFMAQELKEVYPTFVQMNTNGYYSVNYQEMIPVLTKGMQEQQQQIEDLKKEVADLKSILKQQQAVAMK